MSVHITGKFNGLQVLISYSGTFYLDKDYVVHKVEVSDNPKRIGSEQFDGDLITFSDSPVEASFKIVWQKQKTSC